MAAWGGPYASTSWVDATTGLSAAHLNNLETQYTLATQTFEQDLITGFVYTGLVASKDGSVVNQLDVTSGVAFLIQTDSTLARQAIASSSGPLTTSAHSATYYLDLNPNGTYSFATSHSGTANYLTIATVTTDGSGNISTVTDARTVNTTLFSAALGLVQFVKFGSDAGLMATDGSGDWRQGGTTFANANHFVDAWGTHVMNGQAAPSAVSVATTAGSGLGTGVYQYAVSFISNNGECTLSATATCTTTASNAKVNVTSIPLGPAGTGARNLYRTAVGGSQLKRLVTIADNTTTTYADTVADGSLGSNAPTHVTQCGVQIKNSAGTTLSRLYGDGAVIFDTSKITSDGSGNLAVGTLATSQSASAVAIATSSTITTANTGVSRVNPAGSVASIVLQPGTVAGQYVIVINQSANTVTFAASGTSNVADGASDVIAATSARQYIWNSSTALWYHLV